MQIKRDVKKGKKKKVITDSERYIRIDPDLYCYGCTVFLDETIKELRGNQKETNVIDVMSYVCEADAIERGGAKSRPNSEIITGCRFFADDWDEELEQWLINRDVLVPVPEFIDDICYKKTKACVKDAEPTGKPSLYIDGVRQDSSQITMGSGTPPEGVDVGDGEVLADWTNPDHEAVKNDEL